MLALLLSALISSCHHLLSYLLTETLAFLDLQIVTDADVISLLFAIENEFEMDITSDDNNSFKIEFKHPMMKYILRDWSNAKQMLAEGLISEEQYSYWKATRPGYTKPIFDED